MNNSRRSRCLEIGLINWHARLTRRPKRLTDAERHDNTNYELHLRTGRPLGAADFIDELKQLIGMSLPRKKGRLAGA
jgi:hypothetical protein